VGLREADAPARLTGTVPAGPRNNPGGLVAVWAEENSRASVFEAMRRRETYGTSGPRIAVRVFGGFDLPADMCEAADPVAIGDAQGVPMGGTLTGPAAAPSLYAAALRDPSPQGQPLQRIQIVKGWLAADDSIHTQVFDVAGGDNGASVDRDTCTPSGEGADSLCGVWTDPAFDPTEPAWYYVRVLQNPTCRWSTRDCQTLDPMPPACTDDTIEPVISERAWTSPIWYRPR
jgi:hypothetical protein